MRNGRAEQLTSLSTTTEYNIVCR